MCWDILVKLKLRRVIDMLSIDEAIARERNLAEIYRNDIVPKEDYHNMPWLDMANEGNEKAAEEHEQLAEWLEKLKAYREIGTVEECKNSILEIPKAYNKVIDDAKSVILQTIDNEILVDTLHLRLEQLKERNNE